MFFLKFEAFLGILSSNVLSDPFSLSSPSGTLTMPVLARYGVARVCRSLLIFLHSLFLSFLQTGVDLPEHSAIPSSARSDTSCL